MPYHIGDLIPARTLHSFNQGDIALPGPGLIHLQFRRFAGCPICHLHLRSFIQRAAELAAAGVQEVVVFHSSAAALEQHHAEAPFALIPDPGKRLYRAFGVEASWGALLHPKALGAAFKGVLAGRFGLPALGESPIGLPADFLLDPEGRVLACKYGTHANDQWSVDELLALVPPQP